MSATRTFTPVGGKTDSTPWAPMAVEKNSFHFDPKDDANNIMEGYYIERADIPGKDNKTFAVHKIHEVMPDGSLGTIWGVSGGMVLDERMENITLGSFVQIKYAGRKHKKGIPVTNAFSQTNSFHLWETAIDSNAIPYQQISGKAIAAPAAAKPSNPPAATSAAPANTTNATPAFNSRAAATQNNSAGNQVANAGTAVDEMDLPF